MTHWKCYGFSESGPDARVAAADRRGAFASARKVANARRRNARTGRTQHGSKNITGECTARAHGTVHSSLRFGVPCDLRAAAVPSAAFVFAARRAGAPTVGSRTRCRCKCARSTPLIPQSNLLQLRPINSRVLLILLICRLIHSTPCVRVTHSTGRTRLSRWAQCCKALDVATGLGCIRSPRGKRRERA